MATYMTYRTAWNILVLVIFVRNENLQNYLNICNIYQKAMPKQDKIKKEVLSFLHRNFIMSIAVSKDNKPAASILLYHVDDDFTFYFATHTDSYKAKILKVNPQISIAIWEHNDMLIQADGEAMEVTNPAKKIEIIDKLAYSSGKGPDFWPPLLRIKGKDYIVFKIKLSWMRMLDLKQDTMTQIDSPFYEIELK